MYRYDENKKREGEWKEIERVREIIERDRERGRKDKWKKYL